MGDNNEVSLAYLYVGVALYVFLRDFISAIGLAPNDSFDVLGGS